MGQQKLLRSTLAKHKKEEKLFHYTHIHPFTYSPYRNPLLLNDFFFFPPGCFTKQAIGSVEAIASTLNLPWSKEYEFSQKSQPCCCFHSSHCLLRTWREAPRSCSWASLICFPAVSAPLKVMTQGPGTESLCYGGIRIRVAYSRLFNGISLIKIIFKAGGKKSLSPGLEKQMLP